MFTENLDEFFDTSDFAVTAVYNPGGGSPTSISVIYDNEYLSSVLGGIEVENKNPMILCKTSDVANAKHGETIVVNGITYKIIEVQPDGTGLTSLILSQH